MEHLPERDWKHLRVVHRAALERYCARVLADCASLTADPSRTAHERCLALFRFVQDRNDELAGTFDDMRRSTAIHRLLQMRHLGLVTDEDWGGFSPETQERITFIERELTRR
ncbi:MAG TPA: hypothetical protein VFH27_14215 [Longimicrobiaceae bacterium]|nr:hypothetical protein [Longimicrobiaceae bacterium]